MIKMSTLLHSQNSGCDNNSCRTQPSHRKKLVGVTLGLFVQRQANVIMNKYTARNAKWADSIKKKEYVVTEVNDSFSYKRLYTSFKWKYQLAFAVACITLHHITLHYVCIILQLRSAHLSCVPCAQTNSILRDHKVPCPCFVMLWPALQRWQKW